jgi:hypothetical protein
LVSWNALSSSFDYVNLETIKALVVNEAISNELAIVNEPAESRETTNELTVTATTNEQVENTINKPEATMTNQPAQPQDRSGENQPTEIDIKQAKIAYLTAEIQDITDEQPGNQAASEPTQITKVPAGNIPAIINVLDETEAPTTKPAEIQAIKNTKPRMSTVLGRLTKILPPYVMFLEKQWTGSIKFPYLQD